MRMSCKVTRRYQPPFLKRQIEMHVRRIVTMPAIDCETIDARRIRRQRPRFNKAAGVIRCLREHILCDTKWCRPAKGRRRGRRQPQRLPRQMRQDICRNSAVTALTPVVERHSAALIQTYDKMHQDLPFWFSIKLAHYNISTPDV